MADEGPAPNDMRHIDLILRYATESRPGTSAGFCREFSILSACTVAHDLEDIAWSCIPYTHDYDEVQGRRYVDASMQQSYRDP